MLGYPFAKRVVQDFRCRLDLNLDSSTYTSLRPVTALRFKEISEVQVAYREYQT